MGINITTHLDQQTAFYYWVQATSGWNIHGHIIEKSAYFPMPAEHLHDRNQHALARVSKVLQNSNDPFAILRELYDNVATMSNEALKIKKAAEPLRQYFLNTIWSSQRDTLEQWKRTIEQYDFSDISIKLKKVNLFLETTHSDTLPEKIILLPNPPKTSSIGHKISGCNFILLRPDNKETQRSTQDTIATLVHEYIHTKEQLSPTAHQAMRSAYVHIIKPTNMSAPTGYTWKSYFVETLVHAFSCKQIGGYFRPEIYQKTYPTLDEMKAGYQQRITKNIAATADHIAWTSLQCLPMLMQYLEQGRTIDDAFCEHVAVKILNCKQ